VWVGIGIENRISSKFFLDDQLDFESVSNFSRNDQHLEIALESNRLICKNLLRIDSRKSILLCFVDFRLIDSHP
jgi:hypothetical protein